jgi:hypothetical protein
MNFSERWLYSESTFTALEKDSAYMAILSLWEAYYGFENIFTFRASVPINYQNKNSETSVGVGDVILDLKYNIYNPSRRMGFAGVIYPEFSFIAGIRAPTGADTNTAFPVSRWIGKGSIDAELGGLMRLGDGIGAIYGALIYWWNGLTGNDRGDELFYNFTVEGPALFSKNYLLFLVELDGSKIGHDYLLQVCPGTKFIITYGRGLRVERKVEHCVEIYASCPIPIKAEGGYKYSFAPFVGISWVF